MCAEPKACDDGGGLADPDAAAGDDSDAPPGLPSWMRGDGSDGSDGDAVVPLALGKSASTRKRALDAHLDALEAEEQAELEEAQATSRRGGFMAQRRRHHAIVAASLKPVAATPGATAGATLTARASTASPAAPPTPRPTASKRVRTRAPATSGAPPLGTADSATLPARVLLQPHAWPADVPHDDSVHRTALLLKLHDVLVANAAATPPPPDAAVLPSPDEVAGMIEAAVFKSALRAATRKRSTTLASAYRKVGRKRVDGVAKCTQAGLRVRPPAS